MHGSQSWKLTANTTDKIRTAWNVVQRKVWRLPNLAHSNLLPLLAGNDNMQTQVFKRFRKFRSKLMGSNNPVVKSLYEMSQGSTHSVLGWNIAFLDHMNPPVPANDVTLRVCAQIRELNACLDGQSDCGLNGTQIKDILNYISTM